jgi:hypothetical protein
VNRNSAWPLLRAVAAAKADENFGLKFDPNHEQ